MSSKKKTPFKQLTLNFGQKPIKPNQCKECGMIFNLDDKQDLDLHQKYHQERDKVLKYTNSKNEKLVKEYLDGKCVVVQLGIDSKQSILKAIQVLDFVDNQLGINERILALPNNFDDLSNLAHNIKNLSKFYFYISSITKKIEGFCLAEPLEYAYKIKYLNENQNSYTMDESKNEKAYCGITRIWVSSSMRRKGIGTRLLDCVCSNFLYIRRLEPHEIAFSDPTEMGQNLAKNYTQSNSFLIYNNPKSL